MTDAPFTPPRKKINILWWIGGVLLVLILLFFLQLFGPSPRIIVSPQTTFITEPLGPDGLPDYEGYVLKLYREGATPENNAATLMMQALWPAELKPPQYAAVAKELGLNEIPSADEALVAVNGTENTQRIAAWLRRRTAKQSSGNSDSATSAAPITDDAAAIEDDDLHGSAEEAADRLLDQAMSRPWTSEQVPPLARWVVENREPLDLIVEGSRRPRCYLPSPSLLDDSNETLIAMLLPAVQSMRAAPRALSARAMWQLGQGRVDEAWQDILATHRIARLTSQGRTLVEQMVAVAIDGIACDRTATLLHHGNLSVEQAKRVQDDLSALEELSGIADSIDLMERGLFLDVVARLGSGQSAEMFSDLGGDAPGIFSIVRVDWNVVLRHGNEYYDRYAAAARLPKYAERKAALSQIESDIMRLQTNVGTTGSLFASVVSASARSDAMAAVMINLLLPALDAAIAAQDRGNTMLQLTRLAAALAVYRAEHGAYPEKLDELAPGVLRQLPVDIYGSKPFIYKRDGEGYLLYGAGVNGADDGGSNDQMSIFVGNSLDELSADEAEPLREKIPTGADDFSIRVPRPEFKLPPALSPQ